MLATRRASLYCIAAITIVNFMRHAEIRDAVAKVDAQLLFDLEGGLLDSLAEALPPPEELKASCFFAAGFPKNLRN